MCRWIKKLEYSNFKKKYSELRDFADICFSLPLWAAHTVPSEKYNNLCGFNHHQHVWLRDMNSRPSDFLPSPEISCHKFQVPSTPIPSVVTSRMSPGRWQTPSPPLAQYCHYPLKNNQQLQWSILQELEHVTAHGEQSQLRNNHHHPWKTIIKSSKRAAGGSD